MSSIRCAEFDAERRAFSKMELKRVRQQQATDRVEPELAAKIEARQATLAGKGPQRVDVGISATDVFVFLVLQVLLCNEVLSPRG